MRGDLIAEADIMDTIVNRLQANASYRSLFEEAFGSDLINEVSHSRSARQLSTRHYRQQ